MLTAYRTRSTRRRRSNSDGKKDPAPQLRIRSFGLSRGTEGPAGPHIACLSLLRPLGAVAG